MTETVPAYRWSAEGFLRAFEAGAFETRVELVNGEVWPVVIGDWHGVVTGRLIAMLFGSGGDVTTSTLVSGSSLPDPDCWVLRAGARPVAAVGSKLSRWRPEDVLLVAEVSNETILADLTTKAVLYGSAGYQEYWVLTPEAVYVHTEPADHGYRARIERRTGDQVLVPGDGRALDVAALITS